MARLARLGERRLSIVRNGNRKPRADNGADAEAFDHGAMQRGHIRAAKSFRHEKQGYGTYEARIQAAGGDRFWAGTYVGPRPSEPIWDEIDFEILGRIRRKFRSIISPMAGAGTKSSCRSASIPRNRIMITRDRMDADADRGTSTAKSSARRAKPGADAAEQYDPEPLVRLEIDGFLARQNEIRQTRDGAGHGRRIRRSARIARSIRHAVRRVVYRKSSRAYVSAEYSERIGADDDARAMRQRGVLIMRISASTNPPSSSRNSARRRAERGSRWRECRCRLRERCRIFGR